MTTVKSNARSPLPPDWIDNSRKPPEVIAARLAAEAPEAEVKAKPKKAAPRKKKGA